MIQTNSFLCCSVPLNGMEKVWVATLNNSKGSHCSGTKGFDISLTKAFVLHSQVQWRTTLCVTSISTVTALSGEAHSEMQLRSSGRRVRDLKLIHIFMQMGGKQVLIYLFIFLSDSSTAHRCTFRDISHVFS